MMNEPTETPNSDTLYVVQDRLYRVTRAAGPDHLIFIEDGYIGYIKDSGCRFLTRAARKTVVFSSHYYTFNAKSGADQQKLVDDYVTGIGRERSRSSIPFYIDEFDLESLRQRQISQVRLICTKTRRRS